MRSACVAVALCAAMLLVIGPSASSESRPGDASEIGTWTPPLDVGIVGIHAALLRTGKVLLYQRIDDGVGSEAKLFDPTTRTVTDVSLPFTRDIFCSGLSIMPDGRVVATGGTHFGTEGHEGTRHATIFDPVTESWSSALDMEFARWYPSNVEMPDGTTLVVSGWREPGHPQRALESYDPDTGAWTTLPPSADQISGNYPRMEVLPDGRVFKAGAEKMSRMFDPATNMWSDVAEMNVGPRAEGGVVLLPGLHRVLTAGGVPGFGGVGTRTAEEIDLSQPEPRWEFTGSMNRPRERFNLVLLADGTVLAVGGGVQGQYSHPVRAAELYDPDTGQWTLMAAQTAQRMYHSTALLLPDGRVVSAGSDHGLLQDTLEVYSPPYLFKGPRPSVTSAPDELGYGQPFSLTTPDAGDIARVAFVRPGATTHANDFDQRYVDVPFLPGSGGIQAVAPQTASMAPPGFYMLFILNTAGVPSMATWVLLH